MMFRTDFEIPDFAIHADEAAADFAVTAIKIFADGNGLDAGACRMGHLRADLLLGRSGPGDGGIRDGSVDFKRIGATEDDTV